MTLSLFDRFALIASLPKQDSYENLLVRDAILTDVKPTVEEISSYSTTTGEGAMKQTIWNLVTCPSIEVEFEEVELNYIKNVLREASKGKKLDERYIDTYRKFLA